MWPNPQETADLVTFTEEILNGNVHFLCSVWKFGGHKFWGRADPIFLICRATPCKNEKKILYDLLGESLSHHFAKFIGNISCRRGDKTFLICYMTSCDYVINGRKIFW